MAGQNDLPLHKLVVLTLNWHLVLNPFSLREQTKLIARQDNIHEHETVWRLVFEVHSKVL